MTKTAFSGALALLLTAALAAGGCGRSASKHTDTGAGPLASVTVIRAGAQAGDALVLPGRVAARDEVTLTARLGARLTALPVREGDSFRRGTALARFDAPESQAQLDGARAGLAAAALARDLARRQETRMDSLHATRVAALRELEGAQAERRAAEATWALARSQADQLESALTLTAPFDGVVVRRHADPGATLGPGQPILDIRSAEVGEIAVPVPESELSRLATARAEFQIGDGVWQPASLARVDGMTDVATRSRVARFRAAGGARLEAGAFVRVRLATSATAGSGASLQPLAVPLGTLVRRGELTGVFVAENGVARLRWLRVGRQSGGSLEVLAGLSASDPVIADPSGLVDGRRVKVTP
jgi:RND family efflux transporter MFP subunit